MTSFLLYSLLLLGLALLFVIVPVLRYKPKIRTADGEIRRQKNIDVFKQGLADLEQERQEGSIPQDEFERLKTELQRSFLRDMENEESRDQNVAQKPNRLLPILSLLFIPVFSYALYEVVGSARDLVLPDLLAELSSVETEAEQVELLNELANFLQERFERNDDDIQNGYMLGTLYLELNRYEEAIATFSAMADEMEPGMDKATVLGQLAQSMFLQSESEMTPEIRNVVDQALALNPNEYAVMSLLAMDALISEDIAGAVGYWRRQLLQLDSGSREAAVLRERITRAESMFPDIAATGNEADVEGGASVSLVIDIDDSVRDQVDDSMRLFIYARNPAMPMPLAAQNIALPEFPFEITLDDSMAMIANMTLSSAQEVIVGARLSRSGQATAQSGDIQAVSEPFALAEQDEPVMLTIKDIVP